MDRQMASIQKCVALSPIDGADKIEKATILGWECVVKKGEFNVGDLGVYIEIDSIVPNTPAFEFLKERKFRVRTIKLRGQVSQGLFMPISAFPELKHVTEGQDVSKKLGVTKYDPEEIVGQSTQPKKRPWWFYILVRIPFVRDLILRKVKGGGGYSFPTHLVPKTDETRLQAFGPDFLETYKDLPISITQKMDGSSLTMIWHKGKLSVCSRNVWFPTYKNNAFWNIIKEIGFTEKFLKIGKMTNFALQGELCGPGIQGNKYKLEKPTLFIYGIWDMVRREYLNPNELRFAVESFRSLLGNPEALQYVDELERATTIGAIGTTVDEWIAYATTKNRLNPDTFNEGIVVRSLDNKPYGVCKMNGKRFSFKCVSPSYLLQWGL